MDEGFIEREIEVRLVVLAALCGEHILLFGPPGTAKSELARKLSLFCKGTYFERLLTRFTVPEDLFGPLSMKALEEDRYVRQIDGYLPDSNVAFIDEIFKANNAILNTLLTIMNERMFDNGNHRYRIPLICLIGASNEIPETTELDALYDRFLFRRKVNRVSKSGFSDLISTLNTTREQKFNQDTKKTQFRLNSSFYYLLENITTYDIFVDANEIISIRLEAHRCVYISHEIITLLTELREFMDSKLELPIYISDRRLLKAVNALKVVSYTNGRKKVDIFDCLLLRHCIENDKIFDFLLDNMSAVKDFGKFEIIIQRIFARCCLVLTGAKKDGRLQPDLYNFQREVITGIAQMTSTLNVSLPALNDNIWFGSEEKSVVSSIMVSKIDHMQAKLKTLLIETEILKIILFSKKEPSICAELLGDRWLEFLKTPLKLD
jgi:MoxR-like ATPase